MAWRTGLISLVTGQETIGASLTLNLSFSRGLLDLGILRKKLCDSGGKHVGIRRG